MVAIDNNRAIISLTCLFGLVKRDAAMFSKGSKGQIKREVAEVPITLVFGRLRKLNCETSINDSDSVPLYSMY